MANLDREHRGFNVASSFRYKLMSVTAAAALLVAATPAAFASEQLPNPFNGTSELGPRNVAGTSAESNEYTLVLDQTVVDLLTRSQILPGSEQIRRDSIAAPHLGYRSELEIHRRRPTPSISAEADQYWIT